MQRCNAHHACRFRKTAGARLTIFTHGHGLAVCTDTTHVPSPVHGSQTWVYGLNLDNFSIGRPKNGLMPQKMLRTSRFSTSVHPKNPKNLWLFPGFPRFSQATFRGSPGFLLVFSYRGKAAAELSEAAEHGALPRGRDLKTVLKVLLEAPGAQLWCGWKVDGNWTCDHLNPPDSYFFRTQKFIKNYCWKVDASGNVQWIWYQTSITSITHDIPWFTSSFARWGLVYPLAVQPTMGTIIFFWGQWSLHGYHQIFS